MDVTFKTEAGRFNYRVCAVILDKDRLLVMQDEPAPYFYLPGGRVQLHETAEHALLRELKEELNLEAEIIRPLWICQSFFTETMLREDFHELCLYFLVDGSSINSVVKTTTFTFQEEQKTHCFTWIPFSKLPDTELFPLFIKHEIFHLPQELTLITERQTLGN